MAVREGLLALLQEGPSVRLPVEDRVRGGDGRRVDDQRRPDLHHARPARTRRARRRVTSATTRSSTRSPSPASTCWVPGGTRLPIEDPPPRDELMLKMLMAIELGAGARTRRDHGASHGADHAAPATTSIVDAHPRRLANHSGSDHREALAAELVADALIVRAEADLRWLDLCEARLLRPPRPPPTATTNPPGPIRPEKAT